MPVEKLRSSWDILTSWFSRWWSWDWNLDLESPQCSSFFFHHISPIIKVQFSFFKFNTLSSQPRWRLSFVMVFPQKYFEPYCYFHFLKWKLVLKKKSPFFWYSIGLLPPAFRNDNASLEREGPRVGAGSSQKHDAASTVALVISCCRWAGGSSTEHLEVVGTLNRSLASSSALETSLLRRPLFCPTFSGLLAEAWNNCLFKVLLANYSAQNWQASLLEYFQSLGGISRHDL